ncbi:MAG: hypothetical protein MRY63_01425 [Neomegalonema sp.]|nr:hypothetical protein [Neomegalonema sp.]
MNELVDSLTFLLGLGIAAAAGALAGGVLAAQWPRAAFGLWGALIIGAIAGGFAATILPILDTGMQDLTSSSVTALLANLLTGAVAGLLCLTCLALARICIAPAE